MTHTKLWRTIFQLTNPLANPLIFTHSTYLLIFHPFHISTTVPPIPYIRQSSNHSTRYPSSFQPPHVSAYFPPFHYNQSPAVTIHSMYALLLQLILYIHSLSNYSIYSPIPHPSHIFTRFKPFPNWFVTPTRTATTPTHPIPQPTHPPTNPIHYVYPFPMCIHVGTLLYRGFLVIRCPACRTSLIATRFEWLWSVPLSSASLY